MNADDLQVLHSAHNLLEVLDMANKRRSGTGDFSPEKASCATLASIPRWYYLKGYISGYHGKVYPVGIF